jgi:hypothetical protein
MRTSANEGVELLVSYGVYATLKTRYGSNYSKMFKEARKEAICAAGLYGFYMDKRQNRIGSDGWDFQRGNVLAGLNQVQS